MARKTENDELWSLVGFIRISSIRYKTLQSLENDYLIPSDIAKTTDLLPSQVSNALHDLKEKKLIKCMNDEASKGRIYHATPLGKKSFRMLNEYLMKK